MKIKTRMMNSERRQLKQLLTDHKDVFAWSHKDMPGIGEEVIEHKLNVSSGARPIRQKKRSFSSEKYKAIVEEVERLLVVGFIRETQYLECLLNVVLVKKSKGKWPMCVDFTNLNKACPNDSFPLL